MNIRRAIPVAAIGLLLLVAAAARGDVSAQLTSETATLFVYEPFTLHLDVQCDAPPETPELPEIPDVAVMSIRRLPSDPAQRKHGFQIEMISQRDGIVTIPSFPVWSRGESTMTSPLRLQLSRPRPANEMTLQVAVQPQSLRVGQPATVTVTWTSAADFQRCKQLLFEIPLLMDERCHVYPLTPPTTDSSTIGLPVNNIRMVARESKLDDGRTSLVLRYMLLVREPCVLRASAARLLWPLLQEKPSVGESPGYFYNHFFEATGPRESYEEVYLTAATPEITVRALWYPRDALRVLLTLWGLARCAHPSLPPS